MSQQQILSWNTLPTQLLDQVVSNSTNLSFNEFNTVETVTETEPSIPPTTSVIEPLKQTEDITSSTLVLSQKIKNLELWHQRLGYCSTTTMNKTRKENNSNLTCPSVRTYTSHGLNKH